MKSMKEIADELNVTKMTVYNNAKKANVKFQKIDNVNYLSSEDEIIVINRIRKNQNKNDDFESEKKEEPNNDNLVKDETIKQLYNQIDIYKEQSNRDKEQIKRRVDAIYLCSGGAHYLPSSAHINMRMEAHPPQ